MRKRTIVLLVVALVVAACGDGEGSGDTVSGETTTTSNGGDETTTTEGVTTTEAVTTTAAGECDPGGTTVELAVLERSESAAEAGKAALEQAYPGLTVDVTIFTTGSYLELAQSVVADAAVDRAPDVMETGLGLVTFVVDGLDTQPIDETLLSDTYEMRYLEAGTVDGDVYVVPWQVSVPLWFYNKDMYSEAGLDPETPPVNYEEFLEHARALSGVTGGESVHMAATLVGDWFFQNAVQAGGGTLIADDGTAAFDTDEGRAGLSAWSNAVEEGLNIDVEALDALGLFVQGQIGMFAGSSSVLGNVSEGIGDSFEWGTFIHPTVEGVDPMWAIGGAGFSVLSTEECEQVYSTELIREILNPEVLAQIGQATGYTPVDTEALPLLEDFYTENPEWDYANGFDAPLVPWAGWRGERALEVNLVLQDAMVRLSKGEDLETVVSETASEANSLVGG